MFPNFSTPVPVMLREVLDNDTTTRDKSDINGLGMKKVEYGGVSIMMKTGMEVAQYYTVFNYGPPIPKQDLNIQDITLVAGPGMNPAQKFVLPEHNKEKFGKEPPQMR